ncbi:MAG: hypothetical protein KGJ80_19090, partial [Chloroflexota bacterium]|nr:hypothetical protein [Chloroflexota bacterium]
KDLLSVDRGWLCASDRRFCLIVEEDRQQIDFPYQYLSHLERRDRDFYFRVNYEQWIKDRVAKELLPKPPPGMSQRDYENRYILPRFLRAADGLPSEMSIRTKFPQAGLLDALLIIAANNFVERAVHTQYAVQKNETGADFLWAFYSFLTDIIG